MERTTPSPGAAARAAAERAAALLCRDSRVRLLYLYGSAADPGRPTAGDVDLAVLTDPAVPLEELMRMRADLVAATGADIDLVSLNEASVVLTHEVVEGGSCLYSDPPEAETAFVTRTRARYWDFKPFLDEQWRLAGERIEERRRGT